MEFTITKCQAQSARKTSKPSRDCSATFGLQSINNRRRGCPTFRWIWG